MEQNTDEPTDVAVPRGPWEPSSSTTDEEPVVDDPASVNPTDRFPSPKKPRGVLTSGDRPPSASAALAPDDAFLEAGTMLGDYRVEAQIGEGGMGVVYAAVHPLIGKRAAVKVLKAELCRSAFNVERFVDEARIVNQIGHPNIVDVFAFGQTKDGRSYFVMEWLKGESLRDRVARSRLDLTEICEIIRPLARALEAAHEQGVIHRDLKPDNIFLVDVRGDAPLVKLLDFGIAKLAREEHRMERTATGAMVGTPQYIAPEQAKGYAIDHRVDIYALGGILFELLTGRPPFVADNAMEMVAKHLMEPVSRPATLADVPPMLDDLVVRMLSKDPAGRPSLAEISAVIERTSALDRTNVKTPVPGPARRVASEPIHVPTPTPPSSPNLRQLEHRGSSPALDRPGSNPHDPHAASAAPSSTVDVDAPTTTTTAAPRTTPSKKLVALLGIGFVIAAVGGYFVVSALKPGDPAEVSAQQPPADIEASEPAPSSEATGPGASVAATAAGGGQSDGTTAGATADPLATKVDTTSDAKSDAKVDRNNDAKIDANSNANGDPLATKVDTTVDTKVDTRVAPKAEPIATKRDPKPRPDPKLGAHKPAGKKPDPRLDAKADASKPLAKKPKPGRLELQISGGKGAPKITIDGVASGASKELAPGTYRVQVSSPGFQTQTFSLTIHEGATQTKAVKLVADDALMTPGSLGGKP